jgi:hypothetical protein
MDTDNAPADAFVTARFEITPLTASDDVMTPEALAEAISAVGNISQPISYAA